MIILEGAEFHHCIHVSRVRCGEILKLLDGRGCTYEARVARIGAREATLEVLSCHRVDELPLVDIALAVIKMSRFDVAVEKCTELGVRRLIPFASERSVWRQEEMSSGARIERIRRKAIASCKQSGRSRFPEIDAAASLGALTDRFSSYAAVFLAEQHSSAIAAESVQVEGEGSVLGIVGPEGGLTPEERSGLVSKGAIPISLGPFRLRSETAAICLSYRLIARFACLPRS